jgi:hypothetical protein
MKSDLHFSVFTEAHSVAGLYLSNAYVAHSDRVCKQPSFSNFCLGKCTKAFAIYFSYVRR